MKSPHCCNLRACRYMADRARVRREGGCNKYLNNTKQLNPGLFVLHCVGCSGCLGFHMMPEHESPRTVFELLYTRFEEPPPVVVYDNNCNTHVYSLNREPEWAAPVRFVIDKTHFRTHKGCCAAYDIGAYPDLRFRNSQLAEQKVR